MIQLYLASRSPRRSQLLAQLSLEFEVLPADIAEEPQPRQSAEDFVVAMARGKARAGQVQVRTPVPVLGADTEVVIDHQILGKPRDAAHGVEMLQRLARRTHRVYSAVALAQGDRLEHALSVTEVEFGEISPEIARAYWSSGEPADKAGGYAIQGYGARFVKQIRGSYSGVMGLPLYETAQLLERFGVAVRAPLASALA